MKPKNTLLGRQLHWLLGGSIALTIAMAAYTPSAFALNGTTQVPIEGTYALITTFVGQGVEQTSLGTEVNKLGNCDGPNVALLTIFNNPDGGTKKVVDYYDIKSYDALTCEENDPATELSTNNADTSLTSDKVDKAGIEKAIISSLDGEGWKLVDSYVTWSKENHEEGNERELEQRDDVVKNTQQLFWGWTNSDLEFYGTVDSSPYGFFLSIDGAKNDPTPNSSNVVARPIHIKFYRLYDQGCNLENEYVANKASNDPVCTFKNQDDSTVKRSLNELAADVIAASKGEFVYDGDTTATAGGATAIGGCSIGAPGSGANQILWVLLAVPAFILLRRRVIRANGSR